MQNEQQHVKLELTPEQRRQVLAATGKEPLEIELTVEELEQRIAPASMSELTIVKGMDKGTP